MTHHEQTENLQRVSGKIAKYVHDFALRHEHKEFHMADLCEDIWQHDRTIAPDSPSRILRYLAANSVINYRVVNRRQSLYCIDSVDKGELQPALFRME